MTILVKKIAIAAPVSFLKKPFKQTRKNTKKKSKIFLLVYLVKTK